MSNDFITKAKFSKDVENTVKDTGLSYIEAVVHVCEEKNLDPSDVKKFLSKLIKEKIEAEAQSLNFLPKTGRLPI